MDSIKLNIFIVCSGDINPKFNLFPYYNGRFANHHLSKFKGGWYT